jgi:hypothetical protein
MSYTTATIRMWADVDGTIVDITDFECSYAINTIPTQGCAMLPVGREVTTLLPSTAHIIAGQTQIQIPIIVYVEVGYGAGLTNTILPVGTYVLFAGWVTGVGYRHTYDGLRMTLDLTHWLSALTFSSTLCEGSHPQNPAQFRFNQKIRLQPGVGVGHLYPETLGQTFFDAAKISDDMWGNCILPWLQFLVGSIRIDHGKFTNVSNDSLNSECAAALSLFQGDKLPFDSGIVDLGGIAHAIGRDIAFGSLQPDNDLGALSTLARTTIWSKLIGEMSPKFQFALIPFPYKAMIVPFVPGLRDFWDPWGVDYTFMARDLDTYEVRARLIRPLRAWGYSVGHGGQWGDVQLPNEWGDTTDSIGGWYVARDNGLVIIKQAPSWLAEYSDVSVYTDLTAGVTNQTRADAFNFPLAGTPPTKDSTKVIKQRQRTLLDKYAHASYVTEMLRNRTGKISGPLRFDVCPGSTVKIEGTAGAYLAGVDPHGEPRRATVVKVTYIISAIQPRAATLYDLAHVRTESENANADTSIARHPLYDRVWAGDYMLTHL